MMQTCVEEISENLDHSLSSILKDVACDIILSLALLRFNLSIDASISDGRMDGGSMVEVVVGLLR